MKNILVELEVIIILMLCMSSGTQISTTIVSFFCKRKSELQGILKQNQSYKR